MTSPESRHAMLIGAYIALVLTVILVIKVGEVAGWWA